MFSGDRLKILRNKKKLTQIELGKIFSISHATINRYEKGVNQPDTETLNKLAEYFDVSVDYLLGRTNLKDADLPQGSYVPEKTVRIPILGVVRAGEPLYAEQNIVGYFTTDIDLLPSGECFYLKVVGDSMNLSHIVDGQLILIRRQEDIENGGVALVLVNGEDATIKKFYKNDNLVTLMPNSSNPVHQPRVIDLKNTPVKVIGKVIGTFISFER
ncbi:MAG: helix-turn-helix domain-containing protein [Clostridia bacterium]|nr:helix-turn-helix domain-containing protein [Clostridia bacterium]